MTKTILAMTLAGGLSASPAFGAGGEIVRCSGLESVYNVVEPVEQATRTFASGKIRIWHVDTGGEPVCCSSHLVIIAPDPNEELTQTQCVRLSDQGSLGFQWIEFKDISASYDPAKGLLLSVPVERYNDGNEGLKDTIDLRINQATGAVVIE